MIKINLLPPDQRPVDRTPMPRLLMIFATTAVGVGMLALIAYLILVKVKSKNDDLVEQKKILGQYSSQVKQYDALDAELKAIIAKSADVERVAGKHDPEWWRIIDALWSVVAAPDRRVWLDEIRVLDDKGVQGVVRKSDPQAKNYPPFGLQLRCHASGTDAQELTRFRMDLKRHPLIRQYLPSLNFNPDYRLMEEKDFVEGWSLSFDIILLADAPKPAGKK